MMRSYKRIEIPNWQSYSKLLDKLEKDDANFIKILGSREEKNFMKFLSLEKISTLMPNLVDYLNSNGYQLSFIVIFGCPPNIDTKSGIHKDSYPMEGFMASDFAINLSIANDEGSFLVFFDEEQNETSRVNYSNCPILFRTDVFHSVLNFSDQIRLTASLRFSNNLDIKD